MSETILPEFRAGLRAWLDGRATEFARFREHSDDLSTEFALTREFQGLLHDAGWLRHGWPEAVGGLGGSPLCRGVLAEELVRAGYPQPASFAMREVLGPAVAHFAPEIAAWAMPRLLRGEETWCQGFSEPEAGSDLGALRLRADDDGPCWRVAGQKVWTSWAQFADRCVLLARTGTQPDAHRGITALFVDMDTPGITVRPLRTMTGTEEFAEVFFDAVPVPKDRVIGHVGGGWAVTMHVLACERGAVAWQHVAWMHHQLGGILAAAPGGERVDSWAGDVFAHLSALSLTARRTFRRLADGEFPGAEASVDKIVMATAEQLLFDGALEFLPARLLTGDGSADRKLRREYMFSRAATIYGGTAEIQRNIVAERLLALPREP